MATAAKKAALRRAPKTAAPETETPEAAPEIAANEAFATAGAFAETAARQYDAFLTAFNGQAEAVRENAEEFAEAARANLETIQNRARAVSADFVAAAQDETARAIDFANELVRARTVADALEIQRDYWTNLFETRLERVRKLADASVETARESFEPFAKSLNAAAATAGSLGKVFPFAAK
ncbi:phasin family protein [Amphiplicatus metriothermophilus]|uniref:Phasin protein n=1 Tax=Amphiplicatus metriothermophilus TaxID=1519374 RepID=A0A239PKQ2_9PROT|nr:phasin family protein [Amphiplicatus metriothermophilus]MBB5517288.1 hypothetical protein [Amphiplicatus metriothermophilus]SNT68376.1 Phasin protein [Amphiplicatus metriothermophilus]